MSDANKRLFASLMEEVFNRGNLDFADEHVAADFHNHEAPDRPGPQGFKATAKWLRSAFPDYHAVLHETIAEGDLVVGRITVSGSHEGEFMGVPASGRAFSVQHIHIYRVARGKLVEHWACRDDLGLLTQLGVSARGRAGSAGARPSSPRRS